MQRNDEKKTDGYIVSCGCQVPQPPSHRLLRLTRDAAEMFKRWRVGPVSARMRRQMRRVMKSDAYLMRGW